MGLRDGAPPRDEQDGDRSLLGLFASLLAAALVLHVLWWHGVPVGSPWSVVVLAAAWTALRPASVVRLCVLLASAAVAIVAELPALGSHLLLVLVTAACVLAHVGRRTVRDRRVPTPSALSGRLRPLLRAQVVVLYLAAALSKLNADYLDTATSPAGALSAQVAWFDPTLLGGSWHVGPAIWGSLLVELGLPVLLVVRRTRTVGLVLGLGFHAVLALSGTVPFTALMLALYVGFLPPEVVADARGLLARRRPEGAADERRRLAPRGPGGVDRATVVVATLALAWLVAGTAGDVAPGRVTGDVLASATRVLVAGAALAAAGLLVALARAGRAGADRPSAVSSVHAGVDRTPARAPGRADGARAPVSPPARTAGVRGVFACGVVVLVLVAASPYVGRRAGDAFTMYSALNTSERAWNHVLLPRAVRVLGR